METWEIAVASYGLIFSPIAGFKLVKFRMDGGMETFRGLMIYLLAGFFNMFITGFTLTILPEDSWLIYWGALIILFYITVYGAPQYNIPM